MSPPLKTNHAHVNSVVDIPTYLKLVFIWTMTECAYCVTTQ